MMTAEFSVHLLHFSPILFWKLQAGFIIALHSTVLAICKVGANLSEQDVTDSLYQVVPVTRGLAGALTPLLHGSEEGVVEGEQLVQAGEHPLHRLRVQLHLFLHASPENLGHDVQSLKVVELSLHQLCVGSNARSVLATNFNPK